MKIVSGSSVFRLFATNPASRLCLALAPLLFLASCLDKHPLNVWEPTTPRQSKARQIVELVSRTDYTPLPKVEGIEVIGSGEFREADPLPLPESNVPLCPGRRFQLHRQGRIVRADLMHALGMSFILRGTAPSSEKLTERISINRAVPIVMLLEHPPMRDPVTGEVRTSTRIHILGCMDKASDAIYQFSSDWERVAGIWRMRLFYQGRELARAEFSVVGGREPDDVSPVELVEGARELRIRISRKQLRQNPAAKATLVDRGARAYFVIVSSNIYPENARQDAAALQAKGYPAGIGRYRDPKSGRLWHTVRLGGYGRLSEARKMASRFRKREGRQAWVAMRAVSMTDEAPTSSSGVSHPGHSALQDGAVSAEGNDTRFALQAAACREVKNARDDAEQLKAKGWNSSVIVKRGAGGKLWHTVRVGWFASRAEAEAEAARFMDAEQRQVLLLKVE